MTTKALTVADSIRKMEPEFKMALPSHIPAERFTRNAVTAVNGNPDLLKEDIDKRSLFNAVMKAAQDGLILDGREAALVTFNGRNGKQVQYMPMIAGVMKKVRQSGDISVISVHVVKENDHFDYALGDEEFMVHKPALTNRGKTIGAYSIVTFKDGEKSREWMDIEQINAVRGRSRSKDNGPWVTDFDEMARKTVFRRHAKRLPSSSDLDDFINQDDEATGLEDVTRIQTPAAATTETKQTRAASKVKEAVAEPEVVEEEVIDAEFTTSSNDEEEIPL